jgi:hypothetical protein
LISVADQPVVVAWNRRGSDAAAVLLFPYVTETLRTESFFANMPSLGCFSLTDVVATMNSGIRVRESIRFLCQGRRCARTISRRTVNGPRPWDAEEESRKHTGMCRVGA